MVDQIIDLAENLTPLALIGSGGIGKTSIALTVLHNDRIKQRFGNNRRFIRCDRFPASLNHFLHRLSAVTGAGAENPEDLTDLQPFLSSKEMMIVLDNAESVLDPRGPDAQEIYAVVEELSRFDNIWLCITSRISTIPPDCETLDIPTLSLEAARNTFSHICKNSGQPDLIDNILRQLEFHPLSITLLATVAQHNKWDTNRLTREWERRRTAVLHTHHGGSLATTIELSLASPTFQQLGPDARALLEVIAFLPQGVDENSLDWLFPAISNRENIFDEFCVLSLTYRSRGFATMLAPLRDHLCPKDPKSSPLLNTIKGRYFDRLSVDTDPDTLGFEETRWIASEDVNIEHLLDVFTSIDANSNDVWDACANFVRHLRWHKPRLIILGSKIEGLPDDHPYKWDCLVQLGLGFDSIGNYSESRRLLAYTLELVRERGDDHLVARILKAMAYVNLRSRLYSEGIPQAKEALGIYEKLEDAAGQVESLRCLALLLGDDNQVDAAEEAVSHALKLSSGEPSQTQVCDHHHTLGHVYNSRGDMEAAISHLKMAFGIATSLNLQGKQATILRCLVQLLLEGGKLDDARVYLERLKLDAASSPLSLGLVTVIQVCIWRQEGRFEEAELEVSRVIGMYEENGAPAEFLEFCKGFLREIEEKMDNPVISGSDQLCECRGMVLPLVYINPLVHRIQTTAVFPTTAPRMASDTALGMNTSTLPLIFLIAPTTPMFPPFLSEDIRSLYLLFPITGPSLDPHSGVDFPVSRAVLCRLGVVCPAGCLFHSVVSL